MNLYIVSLAEMKDELELDADDAADDVVLTRWMEGLQGRFDDYCRRRFLWEENITELFHGGRTSLFVHQWPIESVATIHVDVDQEWGSDTLEDADDYRVEKDRGRIIIGRGVNKWPEGFNNIRVVYTGGLIKGDGSLPDEARENEVMSLRRAFFLQAGFEWRNRKQLGLAQVSGQGVTVQQGAQVSLALKGMTLMSEVESVLLQFKRMT